MATGLIALLDDVIGIAKIAAASLDDVAAQASKAGVKAAGLVIDDAAVTPRFVVGFAAERELPIVRRIAVGSLRNKLLFLLPAALALSLFAPWLVSPLLMLGGAYLCFEGAEKVMEALWPHHHHSGEPPPPAGTLAAGPRDAQSLEEARVTSAIQTDFILSAEIMAMALATVPETGFWQQAVVLALVGTGMTLLVYGGVAVIVKADDAGVALALAERPLGALLRRPGPPSAIDRALRRPVRAIGRGLVRGMPPLLKLLGVVGTAAMLWVGGGIILHGLEDLGFAYPAHAIHAAASAAGSSVPAVAAAVEWAAGAAAACILGLALGGALVPLVGRVIVPLAGTLREALLRR